MHSKNSWGLVCFTDSSKGIGRYSRVDRIDEFDKTVNELKTTMRDCTCKLVVFKVVLYTNSYFIIVSAYNSDRGRSDSPRAKDVVPLVSINIGNELTYTYASCAFIQTILQDAFHENNEELGEVLPSCVWSDVSTALKSKLLELVRGHLRHNKYTVPPEKLVGPENYSLDTSIISGLKLMRPKLPCGAPDLFIACRLRKHTVVKST